MLNCPACGHGITREFVRRVSFDCPNCGVALRTRPSAITVWGDRLNRFSWWALIVLVLADRAWLGRHIWQVLPICAGVAICIDLLSLCFPAAGFEIVAPAMPANYQNVAPVSTREYDQRLKAGRSLGIT
jgi:hypothetical protein